MKTVIIDYSVIFPAVLANIVESAVKGCVCRWKDVNEDFFEFSVFFCHDLEELEDVLAEYL